MKTKLLFSCLVTVCVPSFAATISQWTFEANTPADLANSATISGIAADVGNGTASGVHTSAATDWTTPPGNGSANSLSANTWTIGSYWQFQLSTLGFMDITVSFDQTSSSTGPRDFRLAYSTDGLAFTDFQSYSVSANAWSAGSAVTASSYEFDLDSITALDNAASVYFRLIDSSTTSVGGGTVAAGGTDRIDNFVVGGTVAPASVPDSSPGFIGWVCILVVLGFAVRQPLPRRQVQLTRNRKASRSFRARE